MTDETDVLAAALALVAVDECDGDGARAIAELRAGLPELDGEDRRIAERAIELIEERVR